MRLKLNPGVRYDVHVDDTIVLSTNSTRSSLILDYICSGVRKMVVGEAETVLVQGSDGSLWSVCTEELGVLGLLSI